MIYGFGDCELDEALRELRRWGLPVNLEPKAFQVLTYLIQYCQPYDASVALRKLIRERTGGNP